MQKRVEFIESYIKVDDSDYQWNDNHGVLVRCKDCIHGDDTGDGVVWCEIHEFYPSNEYYCADGKRTGE